VMPLCLFSPVMYENIMCGQNGYLSGALLGGGLLLLERRPFVAGCLMGILSYKPPLVILTFLTLIVGRCWKVLIGILTGSVFLVLVSTAVFGYQVWTAYFPVISIPLKYLELGQAPWNYTPSTFVAVLSAGFSARAAYLAQGVIMLVVLAGVVWGWRQQTALGIRASILVLGTLLFIPYGFMYELTMLVLPLAWLWEEGRLHGRLPGELLLLLLGWLMPFLAPILWNEINIFQGKLQIGPIIILALFFLALLKAKAAMNRSGT
jgi:alpha-1,2-mannosyltransferase